ncbi:hypothetical protein WJX72_001376 [[Myrmecia] bisecta]|uniref:Uncharacterized protein n=1 Tax=[Myrmecia] bisecta TaxID=41462 RepID=A0AAW1PCR6_9CHLO
MSLARVFNRNRGLHVLVAIGVGVASGNYLFGGPLRKYWTEEQQRQLQLQQQASAGEVPTSTEALRLRGLDPIQAALVSSERATPAGDAAQASRIQPATISTATSTEPGTPEK